MVYTQFDKQIQVFRSDDSSELFNQYCANLFQFLVIIYQSDFPYTPQRNGVVKETNT